MATSRDIIWFKSTFGARINALVAGSVFDADMITALACQETGELWGTMRKNPALSADQIAALCCGDTLDADKGRVAFPPTKSDLLAAPRGQEMFDIARAALLAMAEHVPAYAFAKTKPNKFCHGFGMFQYDLQFFRINPSYFLEKRYEDFEASLGRALGELKTGLAKLRLQNRPAISDIEFCHVAICYNTGGFDPARGLKQGHQDNGVFYGEFIRDFLAMARATGGAQPAVRGGAPLQPVTGAEAAGPFFAVKVTSTPLRLRSEPRISAPPGANVIAEMPDGHRVRSFGADPVNGFLDVETTLGGQRFRGFASRQFLVAEAAPAVAAMRMAAAALSIPEAHLPTSAGVVSKRTAIAGAHSLREPDMPGRSGDDPASLREQLGGIISYLKPEKSTHKRYLPRDGLTFCNIYIHDYCSLSGAYLPRVWWTAPALMKIAAGQQVNAGIGATVDEVRANDLFRWLRDFGEGFGWRRAASLDELQGHANLGGVSLIVARRKQDGRSGHIVAVVPETADETAKLDAQGHVVMPLQSQAGAVNFSYGRSTLNWWTDPRFAEFAFWIHS
jgi:hypothetical protein